MSGGCTNCGKKGGCDSRKHEMLGQVHATLARLYPTRRWNERSDEAGWEQGITAAEGQLLAQALSERLKAFAMYRPGEADDLSDYVYVLCFGRQPSLLELREGLISPEAFEFGAAAPDQALSEVYLRIALSSIAPFAAVQEVRMDIAPLQPEATSGVADTWLLQQHLRAGVFDPILLSRYQKLVAVLAEFDIKNVDFGEINEAPENFDGAQHSEWFGQPATIANYLFYAGPTAGLSAETISSRTYGGEAITAHETELYATKPA